MKFLMLIFLTFFSVFAHASHCKYSLDEKAIGLDWTAYKTTDKTPVHGTFQSIKFTVPAKNALSFEALLKGITAEITLASVDSKDPIRNATLKTAFFGKWKGKKIVARVMNGHFDTKAGIGVIHLSLSLNGIKKTIPLKLRRMDEMAGPIAVYRAEGEMKLMDFALNVPFESLHEACKDLHKGKDGVSKTWDTVDLQVSFRPIEKCEGLQ